MDTKLHAYSFPTPSFDTIFEKLYEHTNDLKEKTNSTSYLVLMDDLRYTDAALDVMINDKVIEGTYIFHTTKAISATLTNGVFVYIATYDLVKGDERNNEIFTSDCILLIPVSEVTNHETRKKKINESTREDN